MSDGPIELAFQAKDGFKFVRLVGGESHGSVKVFIEKDGATIWGTMFTPAEWSSIAASMTCLGETGATFRMFEALQRG
jgi:hypothetical protein